MSFTRTKTFFIHSSIGLFAPSLLLLCGFSSLARAQNTAPVTAHAEKAQEEAAAEDKTLWTVAAGGTLNTGNTQAFAANAGTRAEIVRGMNSGAADVTFTYGRAKTPGATRFQDTAQNLLARLRYDRFFTKYDSVFVATFIRRDPFANLDIRAQGQLGYQRNFIRKEKLRLWGEAGYDFTYDNYTSLSASEMAMMAMRDTGDRDIHSARLAFGYDHQYNEHVSFRTYLEGLMSVTDAENVRLNSTSELNSKLFEKLQIGLKVTLAFDNAAPDRGAKKLDTISTVNLIYTLI